MKKQTQVQKLLFLLLALLTTLAACTTTAPPQEANVPQLKHYDAVDYYRWVLIAPPDAMRQERARLEADIRIAGEEESLVQLAVLTSAKGSDLQQEQRALALLDQFEQRARDSTVRNDYHALAGLWRQVLEPRLQSHALREQIEALTSIEQQLNRREQGGG